MTGIGANLVLSERPDFVVLMNEKALVNTMAAPTKKQKRRHQKHLRPQEDTGAEDSDDDTEEERQRHRHQCPNCCDEDAAATHEAGEISVSPDIKASRFIEKATALQHLELQLGKRLHQLKAVILQARVYMLDSADSTFSCHRRHIKSTSSTRFDHLCRQDAFEGACRLAFCVLCI